MIDRLPEFLITAFLIELTPGPNLTWLALLAARGGRRAGFHAVAGIALGLSIVGLAAAIGAGVLIERFPILYEALRWAGVVFLLYLAFEAWIGEESRAEGGSQPFRRGLVINLLNPKAASVFLALIPGFISGTGSHTGSQTGSLLTLGALYVGIATLVHAGVVASASTLEGWISDPQRETAMRRVFAVLLACVALWLFVSTSR
jgi:threonine/homoserine/homoserine lactone efflux protein